nr:hypothetical protein [Polynucleobacter sp.]
MATNSLISDSDLPAIRASNTASNSDFSQPAVLGDAKIGLGSVPALI